MTFSEVVGGFFIAIVTGVPIAILVVCSRLLRRIIYPVLLMLQSVPKVALAPLLLLWVGYGLVPNMAVAALVAFFPIVINTATGLESVDRELLDLTNSLESGKFKVFWKVRLPWSMPYLFSSLKVAITLSVIGAIVAEFIGADRGLGYLMLTSSGAMKTSVMFGILVLLSILGIVCFYAVCAAERLLCRVALQTTLDEWHKYSANDVLVNSLNVAPLASSAALRATSNGQAARRLPAK